MLFFNIENDFYISLYIYIFIFIVIVLGVNYSIAYFHMNTNRVETWMQKCFPNQNTCVLLQLTVLNALSDASNFILI